MLDVGLDKHLNEQSNDNKMDKAGLTARADRGGTLPVYIPQYVDVLFEYTYANNVPGEYGFIVRYTNDFDIEDEFIT